MTIIGKCYGRRVIETSLDPVPPLLRCGPGIVAMNRREYLAVLGGDEGEARRIASLVRDYERLALAQRLNEMAQ